jgi:antitoxin VapB
MYLRSKKHQGSVMQYPSAKLFETDGGQAVRLPPEFRFEGTEVYIRRDKNRGDVILSARAPVDWGAFMQLRQRLGMVPEDFLADREQGGEQRDPCNGRKG